ncbi:MAG: phosphatase PAP2 family protein [Candidatus Omnitrophota bacterium]|nr:phosphatase PAP2 family protein [Candidatus Omnitrophota bacterium]
MLQALDTKLFFFINRGLSHPLLNIIIPIITVMGTGEFISLVGLALLFSRHRSRRWSALILFAGIIVTGLVVYFLKAWVVRPRPFAVLTEVNLLMKAGGFSFPSGHAALAFMAQTVLSRVFKKWRITLFMLALCVGFARIYAGVHYPLDVLAGIIIGIGLGYILLVVTRLCKVNLDVKH